ncbi:MAG: hypothetical protein ACO1N7_08195 [Sphingobacteriaceae bacterium]
MKSIYTLLVLFLCLSLSSRAQTVDYNFIKSIVTQEDAAAINALLSAGYTPNKDGDYRFIAENKIKAFVSYVKANPDAGQEHTYWAFQARGKKAYKDIFKEIKKDAVIKEGTHFGKPRTEYKSPDGIYYYPFEDSMFDGLYWIYASKGSLLE